MDGVIFDNDGVVVDSEQLANRVCAEVLTDFGWPCTYEYSIEHFLGTSLAAVRRASSHTRQAPAPVRRIRPIAIGRPGNRRRIGQP